PRSVRGGRSPRGWRGRSCYWRRAPPRRPSPLSDAFGLLYLYRFNFELISACRLHLTAAARRAAECRDLDAPFVLTCTTAQPCLDQLLVELRPLAQRPPRDEGEIELERLGHDLAQPPDAQADHPHPSPGRVLDRSVHDRATQ